MLNDKTTYVLKQTQMIALMILSTLPDESSFCEWRAISVVRLNLGGARFEVSCGTLLVDKDRCGQVFFRKDEEVAIFYWSRRFQRSSLSFRSFETVGARRRLWIKPYIGSDADMCNFFMDEELCVRPWACKQWDQDWRLEIQESIKGGISVYLHDSLTR